MSKFGVFKARREKTPPKKQFTVPDGQMLIDEKMYWDLMAGNNQPYVLSLKYRAMVLNKGDGK